MQRHPTAHFAQLVGLAALAFSVLYFASDVIEATQSGFTTSQLWITLVAEAAVPFFVIGLWAVDRKRLGRLGAISAFAYAYAFAFFTYSVIYALVNDTPDYDTLSDALEPWMLIHGAIMLFAGIGFGWATIKNHVYPVWCGGALIVGVILVSATQSAPEGIQLVAAAVRDLGFAGMGFELLRAGAAPNVRLATHD